MHMIIGIHIFQFIQLFSFIFSQMKLCQEAQHAHKANVNYGVMWDQQTISAQLTNISSRHC